MEQRLRVPHRQDRPRGRVLPKQTLSKRTRRTKAYVISGRHHRCCLCQDALLLGITRDVLDKLKACFFPERVAQIYCYALILCVNGFVHIDQVDGFYQESFLSLVYRKYSFKIGYTALSNLLHGLGYRGEPVRMFEQDLIDNCSKNVTIDGHVLRSCSLENDLAEPGYKLGLLKAP